MHVSSLFRELYTTFFFILHSCLYLSGEKLFEECVEAYELLGQDLSIGEALCYQHDLTYQLKVRDHHSTWPKGRDYIERSY